MQVIDVKIVGDSFAEPQQLSKIPKVGIDYSKPVVIYGAMPVWLAAHLSAEYSNKGVWFGVYDPRLKGAVVTARHSANAPEIGSVVPIDPAKIESQRKTIVVAIAGDPNSGKSVFLHLLADALRARSKIILTQEGDIVAPTQNWSLYAPELRKEIKEEAKRSPEERLAWIVNSLRSAKESRATDVILVDIGGGKPHEGIRITAENLAILQHVDYVVIVSRDRESIEAWERELREKTPHIKILARYLSIYNPEGNYDFNEPNAVWHLDRKAYVERKIPEQTLKKIQELANLITSL
jgi:CRISPR-associated Csx3 family protein